MHNCTPCHIHNKTWNFTDRVTDAFFAFHAISIIPAEEISDHINITAEASNDRLARIVKTLQAVDSGKASTLTVMIDLSDHQAVIYQKTPTAVPSRTRNMMVKDSRNTLKHVIPYKPQAKYLHHAHNCINHSDITRMCTHLSNCWWEFQNCDIIAYIELCNTCAGCKGKELWQTSKLAQQTLQMEQKTIWGNIHRLCYDAPLKGQTSNFGKL